MDKKERLCKYGDCGLPLTRLTRRTSAVGTAFVRHDDVGHHVWVCPTGRHEMESGTI